MAKTSESSLLATTRLVRKGLLYFAIFAMVVVVLQFCFNLIIEGNTRRSAELNQGKSAGSEFGQLTLPEISSLTIANPDAVEFSVEGEFPELGFDTILVRELRADSLESELQLNENRGSTARALGFRSEGEVNSNGEIVWREETRTLRFFDSMSESFRYFNGEAFPAQTFSNFSPADESRYFSEVELLMSVAGIDSEIENLDFARARAEYVVSRGSNYVGANDSSRAQFLRFEVDRVLPVDESPESETGSSGSGSGSGSGLNINDSLALRVKRDDFGSSGVVVFVSTNPAGEISTENLHIVEYNQLQLTGETGNYGINTAPAVWEEVANGGAGALKELVPNGTDRLERGQFSGQDVLEFQVSAVETELAYYESQNIDLFPYLVPIYIFRGEAKLANSPDAFNASFVIYAHALL